jgi:uncharacterized repeat protein (TIGR01451 family)
LLNAGVARAADRQSGEGDRDRTSDAGDTVIYTLTATNSSAAPTGGCFEVRLTDTLNANLVLQSVSVKRAGFDDHRQLEHTRQPGGRVTRPSESGGERSDHRDRSRA